MIDYIILIKIFLLVWFWCNFEPLQLGIDKLWERIPERISSNYFVDQIYVLLGCQKCLNMWVTLIITGNIFLAIGMSIVGVITKKIIK